MKFRAVCHIVSLLTLPLAACRPSVGERTVSVNTFHGLPGGLQGCACYFSRSLKEFQNDTYLLATDLDSLAYISIDRKIVPLKLIRSSREPQTLDERDYRNTYSNGVYELQLDVHYKEHTDDEAWWNTGTMRLFFKEIPVYEHTLMGACGC